MSSSTKNITEQFNRRRFLKRSALGASALYTVVPGVLATLASAGQVLAQEPELAKKLERVKEPQERQEIPTVIDSSDAPFVLDPMSRRQIHLVNAHTWDDLDIAYFTHGIYIDENIAKLNHLMRDRRANAVHSMDTGLYDQLLSLQMMLGTKEPVHILSGYRTPETNAKLRRRSPGVAKHSLHMEGKAADIYIPGVPFEQLRDAAISLKAGGVGMYSKSNFVHVDTGALRHWGS